MLRNDFYYADLTAEIATTDPVPIFCAGLPHEASHRFKQPAKIRARISKCHAIFVQVVAQ
jgi:hypothetical protein